MLYIVHVGVEELGQKPWLVITTFPTSISPPVVVNVAENPPHSSEPTFALKIPSKYPVPWLPADIDTSCMTC